MSPYSIPPLISAALFSILGIISLARSKANKIVTLGLTLNCFVTFWWQFSWFILFNTHTASLAPLIVKIGYSGIIFIPFTFFHFHVSFVNSQRYSFLIKSYYFIGGIFLILLWNSDLFISGYYKYFWGYYPKAGILHPVFLFFLTFSSMQGAFILLKNGLQIKWEGIAGRQMLFLLIGFLAYFVAAIDFLVNYGFEFYPPGFVFILISLAFCVYAIVKYRLMDIRLAVSNTVIFIIVYALVLGIPFYVYSVGFHIVGFLLGIFLATTGPFIYLYFQKRAADHLLAEQRRYQSTLRQASAGMGKIKDLKKLMNMIVYVLTHAIQIEHALIYVHEEEKMQYVLGAVKRKSGNIQFVENIINKSVLIQHLLTNRNLIILEEIRQKSQNYNDIELSEVADEISLLKGELIVPIFIDQNLSAIIVMGKKVSGKIYAEEDLAVFSILANQTALAIENAKFYEDMKLTQKQLFQAEKMATIGTMADGLSHQINNRFHALGFIAGDALDTINLSQKEELTSDRMKELLAELNKAFVRVQENVVQGGEIVQGLLKYTRKGDAAFTAVDIDAVLKAALEMAQFKIKTDQLKIVRDYDAVTVPKVKGNFTQLQEVFFNLVDNGYDAMMQRKTEAKEPGFQPTLIVHVVKEGGYAQVIFEDNGMGVKDEDVRKLFTPFFTTKLSSKKGTGLGLYVIKKIVEDNHGGKVEMISKYMHGTQMKLRLPIAIG